MDFSFRAFLRASCVSGALLGSAVGFAQHSIQLGSFATPAEAVSRAAQFPESRIDVSEDELGRSRYRVLLGDYGSVAEAEQAIAKGGLREKIPDVWVNPERNRPWVPPAEILLAASPSPAEGTAPAVPTAEPRSATSFPVDVTLNCSDGDEGDKPGKSYRTKILLDPAQGQGELDVMLRWACEPRPDKPVGHGSRFDVAPTFGFTTTSNEAGSAFRSIYGISFKAFQRVGGWGPEFRYRLLRTATLKEGSLSRPAYTARHEIHTGAKFFFRRGWELSPAFGFSSTELLLDSSGGGSSFVTYLLPVVGLAVSKQLVAFEKGTSIWLGAGYEQRFAFEDVSRAVHGGIRWHGELLLRTPLSDSFGADGFLRYESLSQETSEFTQSDSMFILGFTMSFGPRR